MLILGTGGCGGPTGPDKQTPAQDERLSPGPATQSACAAEAVDIRDKAPWPRSPLGACAPFPWLPSSYGRPYRPCQSCPQHQHRTGRSPISNSSAMTSPRPLSLQHLDRPPRLALPRVVTVAVLLQEARKQTRQPEP